MMELVIQFGEVHNLHPRVGRPDFEVGVFSSLPIPRPDAHIAAVVDHRFPKRRVHLAGATVLLPPLSLIHDHLGIVDEHRKLGHTTPVGVVVLTITVGSRHSPRVFTCTM